MMETNTLEKDLGARIREVRRMRNLTLENLADLVKVTKGQLSKIENGHVSAPLSTIDRIAKALRTTVALLLRPKAEKSCAVIRSRDLKRLSGELEEAYLNYESLSGEVSFDRKFEPLWVRLRDQRDLKTYRYPGNGFIMIVSGRMTFRLGKDRYNLARGDCLFFDGSLEHGPAEIIRQPVSYLLILSNPQG